MKISKSEFCFMEKCHEVAGAMARRQNCEIRIEAYSHSEGTFSAVAIFKKGKRKVKGSKFKYSIIMKEFVTNKQEK